MKIISNFHDYYDGVVRNYSDPSDKFQPVYTRKTTEMRFKRDYSNKVRYISPEGMQYPMKDFVHFQDKKPSNFYRFRDSRANILAIRVIRFCGESYPLIEYNTNPNKTVYDYVGVEDIEYIYKSDDRILNHYLSQQIQIDSSLDDMMEEMGCPIAILHHKDYNRNRRVDYTYRIEFNPNLSAYEFAKVVDPYTAFMKLEMWFCNRAEPRKKMPEISDELKAQSKGFDKYSFRRAPSKAR